jgi:hypothetical protein
MGLTELQAKAGLLSPMSAGASAPILHGRTLYLDADGLAYYCAGNDTTLIGEARQRTAAKILNMQNASQAGKVHMLLTGSGSHKGYRYAVARVKPYQGQRSGSRRPLNWEPLRNLLEAGTFGSTTLDYDREADDRFAQYGHADPENTVIGTQDKDMRMVPGYHLDWVDMRMRYLPPGAYDVVMNDKQFGIKWFWLQMLHGDTADNIPGLPGAVINGKTVKVGEVTAGKMLAGTTCNADAVREVYNAYHSYYKERALVEMLEQAVLLWMRRCPDANWDDVVQDGNPMCSLPPTAPEPYETAYQEIEERVKTAQAYAANETQDN